MRVKNNSKGNILFVILIAVVLFAALSYAVTQSSRGGDGAVSEVMMLEVAQFFQQEAAINSEILRRKLFSQDIIYSNASGGVYEPGKGINIQHPPDGMVASNGSVNFVTWQQVSARLIANGSDVGTTAFDDFLIVPQISDEVCREINKQLYNDTNIPAYSTGGAIAGSTNLLFRPDTFMLTTTNAEFNVGRVPGCSGSGTVNVYISVYSEN